MFGPFAMHVSMWHFLFMNLFFLNLDDKQIEGPFFFWIKCTEIKK